MSTQEWMYNGVIIAMYTTPAFYTSLAPHVEKLRSVMRGDT